MNIPKSDWTIYDINMNDVVKAVSDRGGNRYLCVCYRKGTLTFRSAFDAICWFESEAEANRGGGVRIDSISKSRWSTPQIMQCYKFTVQQKTFYVNIKDFEKNENHSQLSECKELPDLVVSHTKVGNNYDRSKLNYNIMTFREAIIKHCYDLSCRYNPIKKETLVTIAGSSVPLFTISECDDKEEVMIKYYDNDRNYESVLIKDEYDFDVWVGDYCEIIKKISDKLFRQFNKAANCV